MTDTQVSEQAATVEPTTPAPEAVFSSPDSGDTAPPERNYEAEARDMGWVPETEFKGDKKPAKFLEAKEFVERGETVLPFVQRENKRLKAEIDKINADYATRFDRLDRAAQVTIKAAKAQFDEKLASLQTKRDEAVAAGDVSTFKAIDKQITDHAANAPKVEDFEEKPNTPVQTEQHKEVVQTAWQTKNDWFGKDYQLTGAAIGYSQALAMENPSITIEDNLKKTDEYMRKTFPLRFGGTGANAHAPVDSGGDPKPPVNESKSPTFDKLPAEAKAFARGAKDRGEWKGTLEDWAKAYNT